MLSQEQYGRVLGIVAICLLAPGIPLQANAGDRAAGLKAWRDLGRQMLFRLDTGRDPAPEWLSRELEGMDPNSADATRTLEFILAQALDAYGQDIIIVEGRIPLDVNPQCILGLYTARSFPATRLGDWGQRQFHRCVEQTCLAAMPTAGNDWRARLEAETLAEDKALDAPFQGRAFARAEAPYLYCYLIENARSADARNQAREHLARCLWQEYGLESGLRQSLVLCGQGYKADDAWLHATETLEQIAPHGMVRKFYEHRLTSAESMEETREACEQLAGMLLREFRHKQARTVLNLVSQRSGQVKWTAPEIKTFLKDFQEDRTPTRQRFAGELAKATRELQVLQWCRLLDALWTPEEAPDQWQTLVKETTPGSLAEPCSRLFLAKAQLNAGQTAAAEVLVRRLAESGIRFVQAQGLALSAEIAHAKDQERESVRLHVRALQTDRPTSLPGWCKDLVPVRLFDAETPAAGLSAQRLFLKGYQDLMDGDHASAVDCLGKAAADPRLPDALRPVLPCTMMLACLGVGDYVEAEAWGHQALQRYHRDHPGDDNARKLLTRIRTLDMAVSQLVTAAREQAANSPGASTVPEQAIHVCDACTHLELCEPLADAVGRGIQQLYVQARKRRDAQLLTAESCYIRRHSLLNGKTVSSASSHCLLFAAQLLTGESLDQIRRNLASAAEEEEVRDLMCGFAVFALKARQLDLAAGAMELGATDEHSADNTRILEEIADQFLAASAPQRAADIYLRIAVRLQDPNEAQSMWLRAIDVCADTLKDYDQAIHQCEELIRRYPDSSRSGQFEFRLGKLAYLKKDYTHAAGQLIAFQKQHPEDPQAGQAMLLVGLSRMAEGNTQEAIGRFTEVIRRYPDGELAAHSKFLIGYTQISEQQYSAATETLQQLIEQFPDSQYVTQARTLMDRLNKVSQ